MSILNRTTVAKETTAKDISKDMGSILWFQLLIDVLLRMPHADDAKTELIQTWQENYSGNSSELEIIKEFQCQFERDKSVWWYTRESSLYRILNKALREQSIDTIFAFRFFLTELSKQVSQLYDGHMDHLKSVSTEDNDKDIIHVYRGQAIAKKELEQMQASIGGFISINSFFSTSRSKTKARRFAKRSLVTEHFSRILFRIEIDLRLPTKPFADIEGISYYPNEREILFMLGSIFRINNIVYDDHDALWVLNLSLCSEDDFELKELFAYLKKDIEKEICMATLGKILVRMGEYDKAERIFLRINHREGLIEVAEQKGNFYLAMKSYKCAIDYYEQALKLRRELFPVSHPDISRSYSAIAMAYEFWKKYPKAIDYYQHAIEQYKRTLKDNHPLIIQTKNSLQKLQRRVHH
jgi:tetratricopeptide (TPR) repeat protein